MQVFKCFFQIIRRNIGMFCTYIGIFLGLTVVLSMVELTPAQTAFSEKGLDIAIIDRDGSDASRGLTGYLLSRHTGVELADETEALQDALYTRAVEYILFIPAGFGETLARGGEILLDAARVPDSYSGVYVDTMVDRFTATAQAYLAAGLGLDEALTRTAADLARRAGAELTRAETVSLPATYYYFKFMSYGFMMVLFFALGPVLITFGSKGIAARTNASALPLSRKNAQLTLGALALGGACYLVFLAMGFILFRGEMLTVNTLVCALNALVFLLLSLAMAFLVGQLSRSINMTSAIANVAVLGMCFLGGVYVPLELMGDTVRQAARFVPTYWYVRTIDAAAGLSSYTLDSLRPILVNLGVLLAFTAAVFLVGLVVSRQKRKIA